MRGLIDSTLREGAQTVGVHFSQGRKLALVEMLDRAGIEEIELGVAGRLDSDLPELFRFCRQRKISARLALWCRCRAEDIDLAAALRPDILSLSVPASDIHIEKKLHRDRTWVLEAVRSGIGRARIGGIKAISLGLEDATRAEPAFVDAIVREAVREGACRIRLADTVGIASSLEFASMVRDLKGRYPVELAVHAHNDFGMATANSLAALDNGADWADVTVLGLGERAGNARLEEVAGYLTIRRNAGYALREIVGMAREVAAWCARNIEPGRPLVGSRLFHCETGLHLQGLQQDTATYEPYPPETVGARRQLFWGSKVGKRQINDCLMKMRLTISGSQLDELVGRVRKGATALGRPLREQEFNALVALSCHE